MDPRAFSRGAPYFCTQLLDELMVDYYAGARNNGWQVEVLEDIVFRDASEMLLADVFTY